MQRVTLWGRTLQNISSRINHHQQQLTMPMCQLFTSRRECDLKDGIELRFAQVIAKTLGKPLERVTIVIHTNHHFLRAGTLEPAALLSVTSAGVFDEKRNPTYTPDLKNAMQTELDLPAERCQIMYNDFNIKFVA
ncbi:hypothetical protein RRG08_065864 [Elysia crispata]|uniref:D-dopachrome decarboxylase n=1 Tax=Elysia crispata TaxID=231223 RepID=A0AAE1DVD2_9GAST|nr:hypothetical protein RRG08_065864 [Elysia crispata]